MDNIIKTQHISDSDELYIQQYQNDVIKQAQNISDIAKWLIGLEISIANFYLGIFVFLGEKDIIIKDTYLAYMALVLMILSLIFSIMTVFPKKWKVNINIIQKKNHQKNNELSIEEYFFKVARYKYYMLLSSIVFLFSAFSSMVFLILLNWS
jgi:hypothetical protein